MSNAYEVFDADSHVLEPPDLWKKYIDPAYRELAPYALVEGDNDVFRVPGPASAKLGDTLFEKGIGHLGAFGSAWGKGRLDIPYRDCKAGNDPHQRIAHMDREGIDATFLFPSLGLLLGGLADPKFAAACYRAYNRWLADFCRAAPERLFGAAMIPMQSVELAITELRYARKELGMRAAFLRPNPYGDRQLHHPDNAPFWAEAQELDMAIAIHSGSAGDMPTIGLDRFGNWFMTRHIVTHTMEVMLAMLSVVFCGVCERHPKLRFGFFEGGGGWSAGWLDRMDRHHEKVFSDDILTATPREIFQRQCWVAFDPGERAMPVVANHLGVDRFLFATDFPHPDGVPDAIKMVRDQPAYSAEAKRSLLVQNAKSFLGLK